MAFIPTTAREKYRLVARSKAPVQPDEIRVSSSGALGAYVGYAAKLFKERSFVTIKATGNAVGLAISLAETLRMRMPDLHQETRIGLTVIQDHYEPLEEGLDEVIRDRAVPSLEILLSTDETLVATDAPGYQAPRGGAPVVNDDFPLNFRRRGRGGYRGDYRGNSRGGSFRYQGNGVSRGGGNSYRGGNAPFTTGQRSTANRAPRNNDNYEGGREVRRGNYRESYRGGRGGRGYQKEETDDRQDNGRNYYSDSRRGRGRGGFRGRSRGGYRAMNNTRT